MGGETAQLLAKVAKRAEADPDAIMPVLRVLAGEPAEGTQHDAGLHAVAVEINRARVAADRADFVARSLTATQVAERLGVSSRQAVAQRRARGGLVGALLFGQVRYPAWQFDAAGLVPDLGRLLELLRGAGLGSARDADAVLTMVHSELKNATLLEVFRQGDWETLEVWLGDMAGWTR